MGFTSSHLAPLTSLLLTSSPSKVVPAPSSSTAATANAAHTSGAAVAVIFLSSNISVAQDCQENDSGSGGVLSNAIFTDPLDELNLASAIRDVSDLYEAIEDLSAQGTAPDAGVTVATIASNANATSFSPFALFGMQRKSVVVNSNKELLEQVCYLF